MTKKDIVIIGGGLGGLSCGALLAKSGFQVTVFEKTSVLGGRSMCKKVQDYVLDSGLHGLRDAEKGHASVLFEKIGKKIEFATKNSDSNMPIYYYNDRKAEIPSNLFGILKYPLLSFSERLKFIKILMASKNTNVSKDMTIKQWLDKNSIDSPSLVKHIESIAGIGFYCYPNICSLLASEFLQFMRHVPYDVGYPKGGWKQLIDKLSDTILENNGIIKTNHEVQEIIFEKNKAMGVQIGKEIIYSDYVILSTIPSLYSKFIPNNLLDSHYDSFESSSCLVLDIVIPYDIMKTNSDSMLVLDPLMVFRETTKYDSTLAPHGRHIVTVWMPIPTGKTRDDSFRHEMFSVIENHLQTIFSVKDSDILFKQKRVFETVIGTHPKKGQSQDMLPLCQMSGLERLYFVGDSLNSPGIGLCSDSTFTSALKTVEMIQDLSNDTNVVIKNFNQI